jgi:AcrR family transcriptional regulator
MARTSDPLLAERRRRQILEAALACFRKRGFHQAPMQEICAMAQLSAGALYRYFPSKTHLIAAIAEDVQAGVDAVLAEAEHGKDLMEVLESMAAIMFEEVFTPGDGALVADVMAEAARDPELAARLSQTYRNTLDRLAGLIRRAIADGRVGAEIDAAHAAAAVMALIDGLGVKQAIAGGGAHTESIEVFRAFLRRYFAPAQNPAPSKARKPARSAGSAPQPRTRPVEDIAS